MRAFLDTYKAEGISAKVSNIHPDQLRPRFYPCNCGCRLRTERMIAPELLVGRAIQLPLMLTCAPSESTN